MATEEQVERALFNLSFLVLSLFFQTCTLLTVDACAPRALTLSQVKLSRRVSGMHDLHGGRISCIYPNMASIVFRSSHVVPVAILPIAKRESITIVSESFAPFVRNVLPVRWIGRKM